MENLKKHLQQLIKITGKLNKDYPGRKFTLDGRLVGDIGEIIGNLRYKISLHEKSQKHYDGFIENTKKQVQIKATMKKSICYPKNHDPEFFLAIKISEDGEYEEIYNGKSQLIREHLQQRNRKAPENSSFFSITINNLRQLNKTVNKKDRIPLRDF